MLTQSPCCVTRKLKTNSRIASTLYETCVFLLSVIKKKKLKVASSVFESTQNFEYSNF